MKFALAQINPKSGDIEGNEKLIASAIENSSRKNADVVVFPEMAIPGYCIADLIENREFLDANRKSLEKLSGVSEGMASVIGFVDYDDENPENRYNAAAVVKDGEILGIARKTNLPSYRYFDDKRYFKKGEERVPFEIKTCSQKASIGISICEDMWENGYRFNPINELAAKGSGILININASPFEAGKEIERKIRIENHVKNTGLPFAYINAVGVADNGKNLIPFDGHSLVYGNDGEIKAEGKRFREDLIFFDMDERGIIDSAHGKEGKYSREREIYEALAMSIRDYAKKTGFKKIIEPVSGGIDSCLGLAICVEALGSENVNAYNLPSEFNSNETREIAEQLARNFGVEYKIIPINEVYGASSGSFEKHCHRISKRISKENLQSRLRGVLMMLESNEKDSLLVTNGNKTEIALGYATLYGDMCGGISIIGDLSKSDVYTLAKYVNKLHGKEMIPLRAFELKPSAELSHGQADPFDYYAVSPIVDEFVEKRRGPSELKELFKNRLLDNKKFGNYPDGKGIYEKYDEKSFGTLVDDAYERFRKSVFKRIQAPPIIAVTKRAFGYDLRETLINGWKG